MPRLSQDLQTIIAEELTASVDCVSEDEDEDERAEAPAAWKLYSCSFTEDQSVSLVAAVCSLKA